MLELKNVYLTFNKNTGNSIEALHELNLVFKEHEWTYIIGGNGSGKSTLLKIINQELIPDTGELLLNNFNPKDISFVDQLTIKNLIPSMTVYENLIFGLKEYGMKPNLKFYSQKNFRNKAFEALGEFNIGLEKRLNEQVKFLSGGEQQIVVATRITLSNPRILLMDEFTSSLDQRWAPFILQKLKNYVIENDIMVLAITHDYSQIQNIGDRLIMLKNGSVYADKMKNSFDFSTQSVLNLFYEKQ
jgi:putative ABC transport system ATP-binding protein